MYTELAMDVNNIRTNAPAVTSEAIIDLQLLFSPGIYLER